LFAYFQETLTNSQHKKERNIDFINLYIPAYKNNGTLNITESIALLKDAGFEAKENEGDPGILATKTNDTGMLVIFISTDINDIHFDLTWYPSGKYAVNEDAQKRIILNLALKLSEILSLDLIEENAIWSVSYAD